MMNTGRSHPVAARAALAWSGATLLFAVACMIFGAWVHGVWIDEIWTLWMTQIDLPLRKTVSLRWAQDVHPVYFYFANWLAAHVVGPDLTIRRLLNLIPLAGVVAAFAWAQHAYPAARRFLTVFTLFVLANPVSLLFFAEYRAYFAHMAFTAIAVMSLYCIHSVEGHFRVSDNKAISILYILASALAAMMHYIGAVIIACLMIAFALDALRRRQHTLLAVIVASAALSALMLLLSLTPELAYIIANSPRSWIPTSPLFGAVLIVGVVVRGAVTNVIASGAAAAALWALYRQRRRPAQATPGARVIDAASARFLPPAVASVALAAVVLFALNALKPILITRYLIALAPLSIGVVAALACDLLLDSRRLFAAFLINCALACLATDVAIVRDPRWNATIDRVQAQVTACPSTRVYALSPGYFSGLPFVSNQGPVEDWGYQQIARSRHFDAVALDPRSTPAIVVGDRCPTLLWAEHVLPARSPGELVRAPFARSLPAGVDLAHAPVFRGTTGFVVTLAPRRQTP